MQPAQILIVEDNAIVALALQDVLLGLGYGEAAIAHSGPEAIDAALQICPDLVLMDVKLDNAMDGIEAARAIRAEADVPIIYLTAYTDKGTIERTKDTSPYGYLVKPYESGELHSAIQIALNKHQAERATRHMQDELERRVAERTAELEAANRQLQREIEERRQAEEALGSSTAKAHAMFESVSDGIVFTDLEGNILDINEAAVRLHGYASKKDLIGQDAQRLVAKGDRDKAIEHLQTTLTSEHTGAVEYRGLTRDGGTLDVEVSLALIKDESGSPTGVVAITRDITARKQTEAELESYRHHLESLVEARTAGQLELNKELENEIAERRRAEVALERRVEELLALNRVSRVLTSSPNLDEVLETIVQEIALTLKAEASSISLLQAGASGDELVIRATMGIGADKVKGQGFSVKLGIAGWVTREGKPLIVHDAQADPRFFPGFDQMTGFGTESLLAVPLKTREETIGVIEVVNKAEGTFTEQDVDLLSSIAHSTAIAIQNIRLMEEAAEVQVLRELDRLRSELVSNVSHELRTPLGLIKVFSTTLLSDDVQFDREVELECLHSIEEEADRLEQIVDNLLDLSRIQSTYLDLDRQPTDLGQLARNVAKTMAVYLEPHDLVFDLPKRPLTALVDAKRMEQVLRNLLSNASKYAPDGGKITVHGSRNRHQVLVGVSDEGIGIPSEHMENIFERFYRVDNEVTRQVSGAGLGLAVCQGIVKAHGGRIWAESIPGAGSTFYFSLPTEQPAEE